jgi:hypothetical protein
MMYQRQSGRGTSAEKWSWLAASLPGAVFLAAIMYIASKRLFCHDEIDTVLAARLPTLSSIWMALIGAILLPVACYVILRASKGLFGPGESPRLQG